MRPPIPIFAIFVCMLGLGAVTSMLACSRSEPDAAVAEEIARRDAFRVAMLDAEDAGRARSVSSRPDVMFEEDFTRVFFDPATSFRNHAYRWMGRRAHIRLKTQGDRPMRVRALGWLDRKILYTKPFVTFSIDGQFVYETPPTEDGHFWGEFIVKPELLRTEWVDLVIAPSSIAFHWAAPPNLSVAVLYKFDWEPVTP